ncbi:MAG: diguanylate cyclase [Desulfurococcales archaeon ex4484_58]|nr:MAG: diguanylate cyclase [Desulfurococcales archaeon ex4484_58]
MEEKIELLKSILKELHRGASVDELKERFREVLSKVSPIEIPFIEQQLIREGVRVEDILKLCDLHVALFREALESRELSGVSEGHPVDLLVRENEWLMKQAEILGLYASQLMNTDDLGQALNILKTMTRITGELRKVKIHYRKVQMLIFPYLEKRGVSAIPRVLWGREDQVIVKLRKFYEKAVKAIENRTLELAREAGKIAMEISKEIGELIFRENKILYPTVYALFDESEWATIYYESNKIGWLIDTSSFKWKPSVEPKYPYMIKPIVTPEQLAKLPVEVKNILEKSGITPDTYEIKKENDIVLETGFIDKEELEGLLRALPVEITFANKDHRVRMFSESMFHKGFLRTKTIIGRKLEYCHPPRLEPLVKKVAREILSGEKPYRVFWTKVGDRTIRVLIAPVKNRDGEIIGVVELVEDMTDIINNVEEIKKSIMVL